MRGIINIIIGVVFIVGGLSGGLVLRGTGNVPRRWPASACCSFAAGAVSHHATKLGRPPCSSTSLP